MWKNRISNHDAESAARLPYATSCPSVHAACQLWASVDGVKQFKFPFNMLNTHSRYKYPFCNSATGGHSREPHRGLKES